MQTEKYDLINSGGDTHECRVDVLVSKKMNLAIIDSANVG